MKKVLLSAAVVSFLAVSCGPSLCDCVNLSKDEASDSQKEKCEAMEKEWKEKYDAASDEEKEAMQDEVKACKAD